MSSPADNPAASAEAAVPSSFFFATHHWNKADEPEVSKKLIAMIRPAYWRKLGIPAPKLVNLWLDPKSTTAYSMWESAGAEVLKGALATLDHITTEYVHVEPVK